MLKKLLKKVYLKLVKTRVFNMIPDEVFIPIQYKLATGKKLNLKEPQSFNEKIQWIKLHDHNELYTQIADKYAVRQYVADKVGNQYLIPLIGHWENVDHINFEQLPEQFVLKCTHDSGGLSICKDRNSYDYFKEKKMLKKSLEFNYYYMSREWAYKNIIPSIICEKYMCDEETKELRDYKFFCFNGTPKIVQVDFDRYINHKRNIYDLNWNLLDVTIKCNNDMHKNIKKPENFEEMIQVASKLSEGIPELRVDLYSVNGKTYFGELTIYHGSGYEKFSPEEFGKIMGNWIELY